MITANNTIVAVYGSHTEAEAAIKALQRSGFDMKTVSVAACDYHTDEHAVGCYHTGHRMKYWGGTGALWGSIWGVLIGSAFFFVPGIGPLLVAGPLVCSILGALDGALLTGGKSVLGGGLYSLGVPENMVLQYEAEVKNGRCMLLVQGSIEQLTTAREIVAHTGSHTWEEHPFEDSRTRRSPASNENDASPPSLALFTRVARNKGISSGIGNPTLQNVNA